MYAFLSSPILQVELEDVDRPFRHTPLECGTSGIIAGPRSWKVCDWLWSNGSRVTEVVEVEQVFGCL